MVAGGVAGALLATPGTQGVGLSMAANLLADHTSNLVQGNSLDPTQHSIAAITGAATGLVGAAFSPVTSMLEGTVGTIAKASITVPAAGFIGVTGGAINASLHGEAYSRDQAAADFVGNAATEVVGPLLPTKGGPLINPWVSTLHKAADMTFTEAGAAIGAQEASAVGTIVACNIKGSC